MNPDSLSAGKTETFLPVAASTLLNPGINSAASAAGAISAYAPVTASSAAGSSPDNFIAAFHRRTSAGAIGQFGLRTIASVAYDDLISPLGQRSAGQNKNYAATAAAAMESSACTTAADQQHIHVSAPVKGKRAVLPEHVNGILSRMIDRTSALPDFGKCMPERETGKYRRRQQCRFSVHLSPPWSTVNSYSPEMPLSASVTLNFQIPHSSLCAIGKKRFALPPWVGRLRLKWNGALPDGGRSSTCKT
jgi:hypothetical protein